MKLLLACALALASSTALARDVHCDRHIENGHTLQKCEFVELPQAAVPPPAPARADRTATAHLLRHGAFRHF